MILERGVSQLSGSDVKEKSEARCLCQELLRSSCVNSSLFESSGYPPDIKIYNQRILLFFAFYPPEATFKTCLR